MKKLQDAIASVKEDETDHVGEVFGTEKVPGKGTIEVSYDRASNTLHIETLSDHGRRTMQNEFKVDWS